MTLSLLFAGLSILMALPVRRLGVGKCALIIAALGTAIWPLIAFVAGQARTAAGVNASSIERVEITEDRAVVRQRRFDGDGMIVTFGPMTNRWTPAGVYLEALFDITLEPKWLGSGARWVVKSRRGAYARYRLEGPPGAMLGKIVFHPGTAAPETDGSYVIGEFQPDGGEPLPIAVRLENDKQVNSFPIGDHVSRNHLSIIATYDQLAKTLHYVLFHEGDILTTSSGTTSDASQNPATNIWVDEGAVKLNNGRSFGYRRDALYPNELHINGTAYDLRKGRVIVLRDDGVVEQFRFFPPVATARDPEAVKKLIYFGEAQEDTAPPAGKATFGPVIERVITHPGDGTENYFLDLDSGNFVRPLPTPPHMTHAPLPKAAPGSKFLSDIFALLLFAITGMLFLGVLGDIIFPMRRAYMKLDTGEICITEHRAFLGTREYCEQTSLSEFLLERGLRLDREFAGKRVLLYTQRWQRSGTGFAEVPTLASDIVKVIYLSEEKALANPEYVLGRINEFMKAVLASERGNYRSVVQNLEAELEYKK